MGSLLVGISFAKGFAASLDIPMIEINHLQTMCLPISSRKRRKTIMRLFPFPLLAGVGWQFANH